MESFRTAQSDSTGKLLLRLAVGGLLLFHGIAKAWTGVGWLFTILADMGLPGEIAYGVYVAEIVAPVLIIFGVLTRTAALIVAFDMTIAILLVLRSHFFALKASGGGWAIEMEIFFLLGAFALAFLGPGDYRMYIGRPRLPRPKGSSPQGPSKA